MPRSRTVVLSVFGLLLLSNIAKAEEPKSCPAMPIELQRVQIYSAFPEVGSTDGHFPLILNGFGFAKGAKVSIGKQHK